MNTLRHFTDEEIELLQKILNSTSEEEIRNYFNVHFPSADWQMKTSLFDAMIKSNGFKSLTNRTNFLIENIDSFNEITEPLSAGGTIEYIFSTIKHVQRYKYDFFNLLVETFDGMAGSSVPATVFTSNKFNEFREQFFEFLKPKLGK